MAIYELRTFADIINAMREEIKIQSSDTVTLNRFRRDINIAYLDEICAAAQWKWLRKFVQVTAERAITTGTVSVTQGSVTATLSSAPGNSQAGKYLKVDGYNELYKIFDHSAGSTTITFSAPYSGTSSATAGYKIWSDRVSLPSDLRETTQVTQMFISEPLEGIGIEEYRKYLTVAPFAEGRPCWYSTSDFIDPVHFEPISGLPLSASRSSSGLLKTLVFASTVASYFATGDRIRVSGCSDYTYNGEWIVSYVSGTTIKFSGITVLDESSTVDVGITAKSEVQLTNNQKVREMYVYPSINNERTTLNVDYIKEAPPLENDSDEPLIPLKDRNVLLYLALHRAWSRERNPDEAKRNWDLAQLKLAKMVGKMGEDSKDFPTLKPGKTYLSARRNIRRSRDLNYQSFFGGSGSGGSSSSGTITGTPDYVAIYDSSGFLSSSVLITVTELNFINGVLSQVLGKSDTGTFTNKTIDADLNTLSNIEDADVKAGAAIALNKLAATTASRALVSDGSGFVSPSVITSTEVTYLDDVEALTSFAMADNQVAAANVATWLAASFTYMAIEYSLTRGAGNTEGGRIVIVSDGSSADLTVAGSSIGTLGVEFSVDVSGGSVRLRYSSSSTGTAPAMKYKLNKWLA